MHADDPFACILTCISYCAFTDDSTTVRITNLSEDTREDDLRELCRRFGPIQRVFLAKDRHSGLSRGFAFVTFVYRYAAFPMMSRWFYFF